MKSNDKNCFYTTVENSVIDASSKIIVCGIASYQNSIGPLLDYWDTITSNTTISKTPDALQLNQQLQNCFRQIHYIEFDTVKKTGVFSYNKNIEHLIGNKQFNPWFSDPQKSIFFESNSASDSLQEATSCLKNNIVNLALVIDCRKTKYGESTFLLALALEHSHFPKLVELESIIVDTKNISNKLISKEDELNKSSFSIPGLIAVNDQSLIPSIEKLVQEHQNTCNNSNLSIQTESLNVGLIPSLINIILSVATKTKVASSSTQCFDLRESTALHQVELTRPWVQHQTISKKNQRIGALFYKENNIHTVVRVKEQIENLDFPCLYTKEKTDSETILLSAPHQDELLDNVRLVSSFIENNPETCLKDLAFTINCNFIESEDQHNHRLGIVVRDLNDLSLKLSLANKEIKSGELKIHNEGLGVYYRSKATFIKGKLAYLLPGLGSSYVGMLEDLYHIHPLTQIAYDTLDAIALDYPESGRPSQFIYPTETEKAKSQTALIEADFAVTSVLISSFALDSILKEANLLPDAYLGLSTGELGSYIMNGFTSIEEAAPLFYKLNIDVSKNIPKEITKDLITANVFCSASQVAETIEKINVPVYIIADLGPQHIMITGDSTAVDTLIEDLKESNIVSVKMQAAIPYHTPLVEDSLSEDIVKQFSQSLNFSNVNIPSWSCSIANKAPHTANEVEFVSKTMFKRRIRLKETIEAMYEDGVRLFIEVGPNGILTSKVKEILSGKEFIAIASNLQNRSAVTQLHHVKALLFANGKTPELKTWYKYRSAKLIDKLINIDEVCKSKFDTSINESPSQADSTYIMPASKVISKDEVVKTFFLNLNELHNSTINAQNKLVEKYLAVKTKNNSLSIERSYVSSNNFPNENLALLSWIKFDQIDYSNLSTNQFTKDCFTLNEQAFIDKQFKSEKRKLEHLFGRLAAKDAVSSLIEMKHSIKLDYSEIEILNKSDGTPQVEITTNKIFNSLKVSISHSWGFACAIAVEAESGTQPGIDVERNKQLDYDLPEFVLSAEENRYLVSNFPLENERNNEFLKLWTAKEAAYKAVGGSGLKQFIWNPENSTANEIELSYGKESLKVKSIVIDEYIVSLTLPVIATQQASSIKVQ